MHRRLPHSYSKYRTKKPPLNRLPSGRDGSSLKGLLDGKFFLRHDFPFRSGRDLFGIWKATSRQ